MHLVDDQGCILALAESIVLQYSVLYMHTLWLYIISECRTVFLSEFLSTISLSSLTFVVWLHISRFTHTCLAELEAFLIPT